MEDNGTTDPAQIFGHFLGNFNLWLGPKTTLTRAFELV